VKILQQNCRKKYAISPIDLIPQFKLSVLIVLILIDGASQIGGVGWCGHSYPLSSFAIFDDIKYVYLFILL